MSPPMLLPSRRERTRPNYETRSRGSFFTVQSFQPNRHLGPREPLLCRDPKMSASASPAALCSQHRNILTTQLLHRVESTCRPKPVVRIPSRVDVQRSTIYSHRSNARCESSIQGCRNSSGRKHIFPLIPGTLNFEVDSMYRTTRIQSCHVGKLSLSGTVGCTDKREWGEVCEATTFSVGPSCPKQALGGGGPSTVHPDDIGCELEKFRRVSVLMSTLSRVPWKAEVQAVSDTVKKS